MKLTVELSKDGELNFEHNMDGAKHNLIGNTLELHRKPGNEDIPWGFVALDMNMDEMKKLHKSLEWRLYHQGEIEEIPE